MLCSVLHGSCCHSVSDRTCVWWVLALLTPRRRSRATMFRATTSALMFRASAVCLEQETWRENGITYLQYLNIATETLHSVVKPRAAAKYTKFSQVGYHAQELDASVGVTNVKKVIPAEVSEMGRLGPMVKPTTSS
jgi:hypothetical protein